MEGHASGSEGGSERARELQFSVWRVCVYVIFLGPAPQFASLLRSLRSNES